PSRQCAVARHDLPPSPRGDARGDQIVRRARAAEDDADAAKLFAEVLRLHAVEDADDARPFRAREAAELADERALRVDRQSRGAEDVAAVDDVRHQRGIFTTTGDDPCSASGISAAAFTASSRVWKRPQKTR